MALEFDRTIDAITQAAADNGYALSHYWLPWKRPAGMSESEAGSGGRVPTSEENETEPGLLILKPANPKLDLPEDRSPKPATAQRTVYIFLVAQTPALGMNRTQLANALNYESELRHLGLADLSIRAPRTEVDIVGPNNSGAASSLRAGLTEFVFDAPEAAGDDKISTVSIVGVTSTQVAADALNRSRPGAPSLKFFSFGEDTRVEVRTIESIFRSRSYASSRLAFLAETGTVFGADVQNASASHGAVILYYPRGISLLRNAQQEQKTPTDATSAALADADPYLHLSLKNPNIEDTILHFSPELTPYAEEAEWVALVRELKDRHVETVAISASNVLDQLFLAKNLHRDIPDARVVLFGSSDLLFARPGDNAPYIGALSETAYPLVALDPSSTRGHLNRFASFLAEEYYDAMSYTLWNGDPGALSLAGYGISSRDPYILRPPPLWITTIGHDGYYPLSIASLCGSDSEHLLPQIDSKTGSTSRCDNSAQDVNEILTSVLKPRLTYPALSWYVLCMLVTMLCTGHVLAMKMSSFWSPSMRDLAIEWSDEPRRRAVYMHIAVAMMLSMSIVTSLPVFCTYSLLGFSKMTTATATITLLSGIAAAFFTLRKTFPFLTPAASNAQGGAQRCGYRPNREEEKSLVSGMRLYRYFNWIASLAVVLIAAIWLGLCLDRTPGRPDRLFVGHFFSFRCLHPTSGVSPLLPILLVLLSWCLWAFFQTRRLRFSENSRPILPGNLEHRGTPTLLYVSDEQLGACTRASSPCLYENVTCLLITRQILARAMRGGSKYLNERLLAGYIFLFGLFVFFAPIRGLDRFLRKPFLTVTPYEFLVSVLFYPLLVIALTGSLRLLVVWVSLRTGLLEPLERSPLRFAFSRLTNLAWMTMLRQGGVLEYWRDMTRSNEAIRQMMHHSELRAAAAQHDTRAWPKAQAAQERLNAHLSSLVTLLDKRDPERVQPEVDGNFLFGNDLPLAHQQSYLNLMCAVECDYSHFSEALLSGVLLPYWTEIREELVEAEAPAGKPVAPPVEAAPAHIKLAEEFVALRYVSLIRAILISIRELMTFVSVSFVLALIAWNSYPFEPQQWIDWTFTALLIALGAAIVWVFAQMHRNAILSRVTGTQSNELGGAFYWRLATFGTIPVLTWLAAHFPSLGGSLTRLVGAGVQFSK
jgi:hypothetical protein